MKRRDSFQPLRKAREEFLAARFALGRAIPQVEVDVTLLKEIGEPLTPQDVRDCAANLEFTYLLRLFAAFEGALRDYWAAVRPSPRARRTRMEVLMNRVVITCQIPNAVADDAHEVRRYRNSVIHPQEEAPSLSFDQCKSRLGYFLSYLPNQW